jgi:hypothetical protein
VAVPQELFDTAEQQFAPTDHPVFQLVPPVVKTVLDTLYHELGSPRVTYNLLWDVYNSMVALWDQYVQDNPDNAQITTLLNTYADVPEGGENQGIPANLPASMEWGTGGLPHLVVYKEGLDGEHTRLLENTLDKTVYEGHISDDDDEY